MIVDGEGNLNYFEMWNYVIVLELSHLRWTPEEIIIKILISLHGYQYLLDFRDEWHGIFETD